MTRKISDIVAEASQLPYGERAELIEHLIIANAQDIDPTIEKAWTDTALRRLAEIESGKEKRIPGDQVAAEIRKIVGL
jgi:putative addiction module component (TIGR02574 family)